MTTEKKWENLRHALITAAVPLKPKKDRKPEDLERIVQSQVSLAQEALDLLNELVPNAPAIIEGKKTE